MKFAQETIPKELHLESSTKSDVIKAAIGSAHELGLPLALWRLPNQKEITFLCSFDQAQQIEKVDIKDLNSGFICSKFDASHHKHFIQGDVTISFDYDEVITHGFDDDKAHSFRSLLSEKLEKGAVQPNYYVAASKDNSSAGDYQDLVSRAIDAIKAKEFEKVVPARSKKLALSEDFDVVELFLRLCDAYENAFISFFSLPNEGSWIGASPELLISTDGPMFSTVSLAGTRKWESEIPISETSWNQKEIEEQAMVSRYIINCFKKIRLREFEEKGPKTTKAGNLLHLKTIFTVDMEDTKFPELPSVMLDLLHPTSAVAGMPKQEALAFIQENEGLDRSFFSGYLGPVNMQGITKIFVNLRCMQLFKESALLYAGAGVTEDSNPEKEYLETEMKCNTLLNKIIHRL